MNENRRVLEQLIDRNTMPDSQLVWDDEGSMCLEIRPSDYANCALVWATDRDLTKVYVNSFGNVIHSKQVGALPIADSKLHWLAELRPQVESVFHDQLQCSQGFTEERELVEKAIQENGLED